MNIKPVFFARLSISFLLLVFLFSSPVSAQNMGDIPWMGVEEALAKHQKSPKVIMIYLYFSDCPNCGKVVGEAEMLAVDKDGSVKDSLGSIGIKATVGCGFCEAMGKKTWSDPEVVQMVQDHFYPAALDDNSPEDIRLGNKVFKSKMMESKSGDKRMVRRHELAAALSRGMVSYPALFFIDESGQVVETLKGFRRPADVLKVLTKLKDRERPHQANAAERQSFVNHYLGNPNLDLNMARTAIENCYKAQPRDFYTQMWLAYLIDQGQLGFGEEDKDKAQQLAQAALPQLKAALGQDNGEAYLLWALAHRYRLGVEWDGRLALFAAKASLDQGYLPAQYFYAHFLAKSEYPERAQEQYKKAAAKGLVKAKQAIDPKIGDQAALTPVSPSLAPSAGLDPIKAHPGISWVASTQLTYSLEGEKYLDAGLPSKGQMSSGDLVTHRFGPEMLAHSPKTKKALMAQMFQAILNEELEVWPNAETPRPLSQEQLRERLADILGADGQVKVDCLPDELVVDQVWYYQRRDQRFYSFVRGWKPRIPCLGTGAKASPFYVAYPSDLPPTFSLQEKRFSWAKTTKGILPDIRSWKVEKGNTEALIKSAFLAHRSIAAPSQGLFKHQRSWPLPGHL